MSIDEAALLLSGQMVRNHCGTFYFDRPGVWVNEYGRPVLQRLHRSDGPAVIWARGRQEWFLNGARHREDGPAVIYAAGDEFWYLNNQKHRKGGPAVIWSNGKTEWWVDGKFIK